MATPVLQVNHTTVPASEPYYMGTGGVYIPRPPATVRTNGLGWDIAAGYSSVEWSWEALTIQDYNWWATVLLWQPSQQFSHAYLYNWLGDLTTYSNAVVHRPTFERIVGNVYLNVKIVIDQLL